GIRTGTIRRVDARLPLRGGIVRAAGRTAERHLAAIAVVRGNPPDRVDQWMDVIVRVRPKRSVVQYVARRGRIDYVHALVAVRGREIGDPGASEGRQRRCVASRAAAERAALCLHAFLEGAVELAEPRRRV